MIITKEVQIPVNVRYIQYYENLGYDIPRVNNSVKRGTKITVKVTDLQPNSHFKILCQCDVCEKQKEVPFRKIEKSGKYLCKKCALSSSEFRLKIKNIRTGKKHKPETIDKMKLNKNHPGRFPSGKNHPNYNHNLTEQERYNSRHRSRLSGYINWVKSILERDNYTCQKCGSNRELCAHHINNYANFKKERLNLDNGITLCKDCHKEIHQIFGKHSLRESFNEWMKFKTN